MSKFIAVDIGHGSNTSGKGVQKGNTYYREHNFNSSVGLQLEKLLKHNGFRVLMYQKAFSKEVGLNTRIKYYNQQKVDMVVSIHADANSNKRAKGRYAFYWHTSSQAKKLAELYASEVKALGYTLRGNGTEISKPNSWTNLAIPRDSRGVAILTENGFMTNDDDFELIFKSEKYVMNIAKAHAKAICKYYGVAYRELGKQPDKDSKPPISPTTNTTHKVLKGDTLWSLAKKYGTTVDKLKKLNPSVASKGLLAGDSIIVKEIAAPPKPPVTPGNSLGSSNAVRPYPGKPLANGTKGRDVEAIQRALGFKGSAIDGIYGNNTANAVKKYQNRHNLKATGIVDISTWNTIF